ncbi:MAG: hypothetical protein FWD39_03685 [Clostridiales bacterium]|nr:hypothetical protein [Clostridiales bacterium]
MKKKFFVTLLCLTLLAVLCGCVKPLPDQHYVKLINSKDYKRQVEILPELFGYEKVEEIYQSTKNPFSGPEGMYDTILLRYLVALIETDEDQLLKDNVVDILRKFKNTMHLTQTLVIITIHEKEKVEIFLPEMIRAYEEIEEANIWERLIWNSHIYGVYYVLDDEENLDMIDKRHDELLEEYHITIEFFVQIRDGLITIDDVPLEYRRKVELLPVRY